MAETPEEIERARRAFARIRQWGDPVLREKARPVDSFDSALADQIADMQRIMVDADGAGLAATQVGILRRLFVYRLPDDEAPRAIVNPEIVDAGAELESRLEGCLSLGQARVHVEVERPHEVVVEGRDAQGNPLRIEAVGDHARVLQHELDHLDGVLMLDRTSREQRRGAVRALRLGERYRPEVSQDEAAARSADDENGRGAAGGG
jgi:peptide deformylase